MRFARSAKPAFVMTSPGALNFVLFVLFVVHSSSNKPKRHQPRLLGRSETRLD